MYLTFSFHISFISSQHFTLLLKWSWHFVKKLILQGSGVETGTGILYPSPTIKIIFKKPLVHLLWTSLYDLNVCCEFGGNWSSGLLSSALFELRKPQIGYFHRSCNFDLFTITIFSMYFSKQKKVKERKLSGMCYLMIRNNNYFNY